MTVRDVNDGPSVVLGQTFYLVEGSDLNAAVTTDASGESSGVANPVLATDPDDGQVLTYPNPDPV